MMVESSHPKPHAIVFPYPFQGHITPMLDLALNLASNGFKITYIQLEFIHHAIAKAHDRHELHTADDVDFFVGARRSGLDMHYVTISDGFPLEFDRDLNVCEYWESMMLDFPARIDELVGNIKKAHGAAAPALFLVADAMYTWPSSIAMKHSIVHVSLWIGSAALFLMNYDSNFPIERAHSTNVGESNGPPTIPKHDKMKRIQEPDSSSVLMATVVKAFEQVKHADVILLNTLLELEPSPLSAITQTQASYAIGPINFLTHSTSTDVERSLFRESDCSAWLDSKPSGSVLYISFGSISEISKHEVGEIAQGLMQSEVSFLWVVKSDGGGKFDGFLDRVRVRDRGLIVPWCNQTRVLSHQAVVGFLTHCGWNSILESVWHGVPMICHPILFDQPMNRKLVVEDWKVGIDLCDGGEVSEEEVVGKIKVLMRGGKGCDLRKRIEKMSKMLRNALDANGSSKISFDQFVHNLKARVPS